MSTLAALVAAGGGVPVCKHGNRAASSRCGAADLLEALGVAIELSPAGVARCVEEVGIGFCLAPRFHPALRHAGPARREMGIPTAFNILGPLANPARVRRMLLGVADPSMAERMLAVLEAHGADTCAVGPRPRRPRRAHHDRTVHRLGAAGRRGVTRTSIDPAEFGRPRADAADLRGGTPDINADRAIQVLAGERGAHRDIVVLNAGAALMVGAAVPTLEEGMALAAQVLDDGRAIERRSTGFGSAR